MFFNWVIFVDRGAGWVPANALNLPCAGPAYRYHLLHLAYIACDLTYRNKSMSCVSVEILMINWRFLFWELIHQSEIKKQVFKICIFWFWSHFQGIINAVRIIPQVINNQSLMVSSSGWFVWFSVQHLIKNLNYRCDKFLT